MRLFEMPRQGHLPVFAPHASCSTTMVRNRVSLLKDDIREERVVELNAGGFVCRVELEEARIA
jgi:hypothetical protein